MALIERGSVNLSRTLNSLRHRNFVGCFLDQPVANGDFIQPWHRAVGVDVDGLAVPTLRVGFCQALPRLLWAAVGGAIVDASAAPAAASTQISAMAQAFIFWALAISKRSNSGT